MEDANPGQAGLRSSNIRPGWMLSSTSMVKPKQDIPTGKNGNSKHANILNSSAESKLEKLCTGNDKSRCRRSKTGMANPKHAELLTGSNKSRWT